MPELLSNAISELDVAMDSCVITSFIFLDFITSSKGGGYVFVAVVLSVSRIIQDITDGFKRTFSGEEGNWTKTNHFVNEPGDGSASTHIPVFFNISN